MFVNVGLRRFLTSSAVSPATLFQAGEVGAWYDPSDVANLDWRYNLLTYTEQFENAYWSKRGASTVVANQDTAPDGSMTADLLRDDDVQTEGIYIAKSRVFDDNTNYVASVYFKAPSAAVINVELQCYQKTAPADYVVARFVRATGAFSFFKAGSAAPPIDGGLINVGAGWWRMWVAFNSGAGTSTVGLRFNISFAGSSTGDGSINCLFWGGQLERGTAPSPYQRISDVNTEVVERFPATTLYQDTAGTTPVTTPGQSVALMRDKSGRGNHATQGTAASRPIYAVVPQTGRRNLLTYTEQFDNAAWAKHDSLSTVNSVSFSSNATSRVYQPVSSITSSSVTMSVRFVNSDAGKVVRLAIWANGLNGLTDGASPNLTIPESGIISYTWTSVTNLNICGILNSSTGGAKTVTLASSGGAQFELGSIPTAYQRVGNTYDVTEPGVPSLHYLSFDGVDDWMQTGTITPGTDKVQVFAGVRKLSDAATGILAESSGNSETNNGVFNIAASGAAVGSAGWSWASKGTTAAQAQVGAGYASPVTSVVTGLGDIAADASILRVNGAQVASSTADQGTGNFLAYPLFIGRRGGSSLPFNGHLYGLIVRGAASSASQITSTERWLARKTGVVL